MPDLFDSLKIRDIEFPNRIFVSPMCQYSSEEGKPTDWHLVHLGSRAVGGAGLVMVEATAVNPEGRITFWDSGIWSDAHAEAFRRITRLIHDNGSIAGIQLAHAGRKASTDAPWRGGGTIKHGPHSWKPVAPSALAFRGDDDPPHALTHDEIDALVVDFERATERSLNAGFRTVELHFAHGYLVHQFLSPLSNHRDDEYGGTLENRMRLALRIAKGVRARWPERLPLFVRISATDWAEGGWDLGQSIELCRRLEDIGVDLIDCSSGGLVAHAKVEIGPGYQVPFAREVRKATGMMTGAVGLITEAVQASEIIRSGAADAVLLARQFLRDPYFPRHAARELGVEMKWPPQYERAAVRK